MKHFLLLYWSLSLSLSLSFFATNSFEVPYFDRGGGGWSYLISRAFFIIYLNFSSWFRNPLKSCRDIKNSFQLFQAYIKTSALYISISFYFSFFFLFKNIVSIGYKQGISVDPHMWPIPQVMWRELLVASPIYISLRLLWLFRVMEGGEKKGGWGKRNPVNWMEARFLLSFIPILPLFDSSIILSSSTWCSIWNSLS